MAKKKQNNKPKKKTEKPKLKDEKKANASRKTKKRKKSIPKETKPQSKKKDVKFISKITKALGSEEKEVWKKNLVLAVIVVVLIGVNIGIYFSKNRGAEMAKRGNMNLNEAESVAGGNQEEAKNVNDNRVSMENEEDEKNDETIQNLIKEKKPADWKTYRNNAYGFTISYPKEWLAPKVIGPQKDFKYRYKITFSENPSEKEAATNGFSIFVYRSTQSENKLQAGYTDNLTTKDTAAADLSNCKELEIFSIGEAEYPAIQIYAKKNDPCFREAYFFSLQKGFYIYDLVPNLKTGINYDGYDGEKKVGEEFPDFYRILATLDFPVVPKTVNNQITKPAAAPKVEAPRVVSGIRCPEKIQHPHKSSTKGRHMDEDCCPDPDEWPKPGCAYSAHDYSIMLKGKPK